jgi:CDP-2,3-bis-(O-geranylgeranyl)-sn-glycerol synthase
MHPLLVAQLLTLLAVANGTPIIVEKFLGKSLAFPVDGDATLRGLALSILATTALAPLIGLDWRIGALVALAAMLGDLLSSFWKRRVGLAPSWQAIGLDQIPESLLPLLACWFFLPRTIVVVIATSGHQSRLVPL